MIRVRYHEQRYHPELYCDVCGRRIQRHDQAVALFELVLRDGQFSPVLHAHRGRCQQLAESSLGGQPYCAWVPLQRHLRQLAESVGLGEIV